MVSTHCGCRAAFVVVSIILSHRDQLETLSFDSTRAAIGHTMEESTNDRRKIDIRLKKSQNPPST